ncbi:MAG: BolA family transcriptional regulator [Gammaproteobacteria bacterium]|nr:MAG: BolA family transcriptional regulator [Gammaproteobacteria bacterium]RLA56402.1 MAG: BolA family transcriptional regulator [Gammaproteobacteria bacterium]HDY83083.1 BolA/IbaG family iron-sulfur metabolism protein [Halieaceae bacterium]
MTIQQEIEQQLKAQFNPLFLDVANESHQHSVPPNSETHFRVIVVSEAFDDRRKVARHQQVYAALTAQLEGPVHALALHTYTADEWHRRQQDTPASPECRGAGKSD